MHNKMKFVWLIFLIIFGGYNIQITKLYGIHIDDYTQYAIGEQNHDVLIGRRKIQQIDPGLKFYGPAFETLCYAIDKHRSAEPQPYQKWGLRHGLIVAFFCLAAYLILLMVAQTFKSDWVGMLTSLLFILHPRLFADMHYNSKDSIFLSFITIAIYFYFRYFQNSKLQWLIWAAIATGIASTLRITGFFSIPVFIILCGYKDYKHRLLNFKKILQYVFFGILVYVFFVLFMPSLWQHPFQETMALLRHITAFPWPNETLLAGQWVSPAHMPWWYLPVWFFITTPVLYILLFLVAIVLFFSIKKYGQNTFLVFIFGFLFLTVGYITITQPNLYDSWRQLQFLAVLFFILLAIPIHRFLLIIKSPLKKWTLTTLLGTYALWNCFAIHPYQYVYFNEYYQLFGKTHTYDQDYWNLSVADCMRWISAHDDRKEVRVYIHLSNSVWLNRFFYPKDSKTLFVEAHSRDSADYEIEPIRNRKFFDPGKKVVYSLIPLKDTVARVIELR